MAALFRSPVPSVWPEARPLSIGAGDVGVVMSHGFTGSVQSIAPWAHGLATPEGDWPGVRVVAPRLPGHGTAWSDLARTRWWDWFAAVEDAYLGEDLYRRIMGEFLRRLERKRLGVRD